MSRAAVEVHRLAVRRSGRSILDVEDFRLQHGEVAAILGPNGAGKSTLLKCLLGLIKPTAGEIWTLGNRVSAHSGLLLSRLRRRIGYVPQVLAAHSETPLTVREVAAIGRTGLAGLFHRLTPHDWEVVDAWLDAMGLADLSRRAYSSLSGGEQRKTLLAKAMVQEPEILMLDEPTANLDLFWREQIVATLQGLHKNSRLTIILVCHELEVLPECVGRLLVLQNGKIAANGRPASIMTQGLLETLYGTGTRLQLMLLNGRYAAVPVGGCVHD